MSGRIQATEAPPSTGCCGPSPVRPTSDSVVVDGLSPQATSFSWSIWGLFICAIVGSLFMHELGHCIVVWFHGYGAVPTPAKEYLLSPIPQQLQNAMALGGILGSVVALVGATIWFWNYPGAKASVLVAGAMITPGFYTVRFILLGRGHDGAEFQEAQAGLGLAYAGHALDWLFVFLLVAAGVCWMWRARQRMTWRFAGRIIAGSLVGLVALVLLQSINNAIFDPLFLG